MSWKGKKIRMALIEGEFGLIDKYFAPLSKSAPGAVNLTDDVAFFEVAQDWFLSSV